jgi:Zn-dependent protease with chaperone function
MPRRWLQLACAVLAGMLLPGSAVAREAIDYSAAIPSWQAHESRLLSLGWRLARANAPLCLSRQRAIGLMLADVRRYKDPARARAAMGIGGDVAIAAVAAGSPAEAAGLRAGMEVLAIDGQPVAALADRHAKGNATADAVHDHIDSQLVRQGSATLRIAPRGEAARDVTLSGEPICRARFAMLRGGSYAQTRGFTIEVAVQLLAEAPGDDEAATMIAHELAHNVFGHWQRNVAAGLTYVAVRRGEREADRMALWLMANAGFDPAAAPRFFAQWGPRHSGGMTRSPTHDSWQDRVAAINAELPVLAQARQGGQLADWRVRFSGQLAE